MIKTFKRYGVVIVVFGSLLLKGLIELYKYLIN
jgi:hypothetical protein